MRILTKVFASAMILGLFCAGCKAQENTGIRPENQQTLPQQEIVEPTVLPTEPEKMEIILKLPEDFQDCSGQDLEKIYDRLYSNGEMGVGVSRIAKPDGFSLKDFVNRDAEYYHADLIQKDGFWTLSYQDQEGNEPQTMVNVYYENADDFWIVQGYCTSQSYAQYEAQLWQYITSAEFAEN